MNIQNNNTANTTHYPVMLKEVMTLLEPKDNEIYVDATFGGGGYSKEILKTAHCQVWGIDRDPDAIDRGQELKKLFPQLNLIQGEFGDIDQLLQKNNITNCHGIVIDLGVSSYQLDQADRGFSFRFDGPLDMRMSKKGKTASELINNLSAEALADIFWYYGEERFSRRIARAIVKERMIQPIQTTQHLAALIKKTIPIDKSGINPATRSFQALRIAVNNELEQIYKVMQKSISLLKPNGKLIVVSFHSLEDRIIKEMMNKAVGNIAHPSRHQPQLVTPHRLQIEYKLLTPKALRPSEQECYSNSRSRSARLRGIKRLQIPKPEERKISL